MDQSEIVSRDNPDAAPPVALVTGGSRGIGRAICQALAEAGYAIAINFARNIAAAEDARAPLERRKPGSSRTLQADIARRVDRERLVEECWSWHGRIDLLVNNAGVAPSERRDVLDMTEASWDRVMEINLKGPMFLTQAVAGRMISAIQAGTMQQGRIVTISSISSYTASTNRAEYCISKAGLSMMTKVLAARLADERITVYEICPGVISTEMTEPVHADYERSIAHGLTPQRRWGQPDDVARAVRAIAEGDFPFSTGQVFHVDGGFQVRRL